MTIRETKHHIEQNPEYWLIPFMEFVDDFRRYRDLSLIRQPFELFFHCLSEASFLLIFGDDIEGRVNPGRQGMTP